MHSSGFSIYGWGPGEHAKLARHVAKVCIYIYVYMGSMGSKNLT